MRAEPSRLDTCRLLENAGVGCAAWSSLNVPYAAEELALPHTPHIPVHVFSTHSHPPVWPIAAVQRAPAPSHCAAGTRHVPPTCLSFSQERGLLDSTRLHTVSMHTVCDVMTCCLGASVQVNPTLPPRGAFPPRKVSVVLDQLARGNPSRKKL
jgi:hypothetical protein